MEPTYRSYLIGRNLRDPRLFQQFQPIVALVNCNRFLCPFIVVYAPWNFLFVAELIKYEITLPARVT